MSPGSIRRCSASPRVSLARATVGGAWAAVHCIRSCLLRERWMTPFVAIAAAATRAIKTTRIRRRGFDSLTGCEDIALGLGWMCRCRYRVGAVAVTSVDHGEHCRHQEQRCAGGEQQAADHGATKRRILL